MEFSGVSVEPAPLVGGKQDSDGFAARIGSADQRSEDTIYHSSALHLQQYSPVALTLTHQYMVVTS
jgi:hypothetical protein